LICGLENDFNEILAESTYNNRKNNRFVPYRVNEYSAPETFGDIAEFLINGEWTVCEFGGEVWWEESNRVGNSHTKKPNQGGTHTQEWKENNSRLHIENWKTRDKTQITKLGKSTHKRSVEAAQLASRSTGHPHKRRHWVEEVFNAVRDAYLGRSSHHWGKKDLAKKFEVSERSIENMVKYIAKGKTYAELV